MDQNIIGLVLKTIGYPDQVTLSACHDNQVNLKISISKNPNFAIIKIQSTLQLEFLHLRVIYEVYGLFNSWKSFVCHRIQFLIIATISNKCPYFATRLCFHGNPGNHGNNLKIFSVPLAWPNILTF